MLTSLTVENFRNLESISLDRLGRITLLAGKNGTGKTALLEALWLLSGADLPELSTRVSTFRGLPVLGPDTIFHDIFRNFNTDKPIRIRAAGDWSKQNRSLEISLKERQQVTTIRSEPLERSNVERLTRPADEGGFEIVFTYRHNNGQRYVSRAWWVAEQLGPTGAVPALTLTNEGIRQERQPIKGRPTSVFMAAGHRENIQTTASKLGQLQLLGKEDKVLEFLRPLEPRLRGLLSITIRNTNVIHAYIDDTSRPMPVYLLGEGLNRMLLLALAMSEAAGGLVLVDEIENGLHYSVQEEVFSLLLNLAHSFDVQIFATTHSGECIRAAHRALGEHMDEEFGYYHLERFPEGVEAVRFDREMRETAIAHNMEVR